MKTKKKTKMLGFNKMKIHPKIFKNRHQLKYHN